MSNPVIISSCSRDSIIDVEFLIKFIYSKPGVKSLLILTCEKNSFSVSDLLKLVKEIDIPVYGGVFPALIVQSKLMWKGTTVIGFPFEVAGGMIHDIHDENTDLYNKIKSLLPATTEHGTTMIMVDGYSKNLNRFVWTVKDVIGTDNVYIGGGAGYLSVKNQPCLFSNRVIANNAAVILQLPFTGSIGVAHGWESVNGPYHVTDSEENSIVSLNSRPAFEVYKKALMEKLGESKLDDLVSIAKSYPFGIRTEKDEHIVRDPISFSKKSTIQCIGEIPIGAEVDILYGDRDTLISAASWAYKIASEKRKRPVNECMNFMVDCISRVMFLGDNFDQELAAVSIDSNTIFGICSLGEIASSNSGYLEFYNKTIAFGSFDVPIQIVNKCIV